MSRAFFRLAFSPHKNNQHFCRHKSRRLFIEPLEDRRMLAVFTVTNLNDAAVTMVGQAPGTLRQAIFDANHAPGADSIQFQAGVHGTLTLTQGELDVTDSVSINGPGANAVTINAGGINSAFATNTVGPINVTIDAFTITGVQMNDFLAGPPAINIPSVDIANLTVQNSLITSNGGNAVGYRR